jgi:hypothetical protein
MGGGMMLAAVLHAQGAPNDFNAAFGDFGNLLGYAGLPTGQKPFLVYGADVGLGETDNVNLSSTDKLSQTIGTVDADFAVNQHSRLLDLRAAGAFSDLSYLEGAYGNELIGRFDGVGQFALIPERLVWVLRDDFGQSTLDAFTPVTPNNRENVNYVSTGPNLSLKLGGTGFLDITARYADAYYQTSPFDSNRALATVAGGLQMSARSSVSLNIAGERVLFQNTVVNSDFDRYALYGRYEARGARTSVAVDLGASRVNETALAPTIELINEPPGSLTEVPMTVPGHPEMTTTSPLGRLELSRMLSPSAKVTLTGGRELTDAASSFSSQTGSTVSTINFAPTPLTTDSYVSTYGSAGWQYTRYRTTFEVAGRWERDSYPGAPQFDLTSESVEFNVQRRLTQNFAAQLLGRWYKLDYPNATIATNLGSPESDTKLIGATLIWRRGRWFEARLRYQHATYTVSQGDFGYGENTVFLTVGYRPRNAQELPEPGAIEDQ